MIGAMSLRAVAIVVTGLGVLGTVLGVALLPLTGPGFPLVVLAQPFLVAAMGLWLAVVVESRRAERDGDRGAGGSG